MLIGAGRHIERRHRANDVLVSIYAASKCAIEGFTESLLNELELFNIRARLIELGLVPERMPHELAI